MPMSSEYPRSSVTYAQAGINWVLEAVWPMHRQELTGWVDPASFSSASPVMDVIPGNGKPRGRQNKKEDKKLKT